MNDSVLQNTVEENMVEIEKETYLLASEAARHLKISRVKFYEDYKHDLQQFTIGRLKRPHYKLSDVKMLHKIRPVAISGSCK
jgi:hypothetical protein